MKSTCPVCGRTFTCNPIQCSLSGLSENERKCICPVCLLTDWFHSYFTRPGIEELVDDFLEYAPYCGFSREYLRRICLSIVLSE